MSKIDSGGVSLTLRLEQGSVFANPEIIDATEFYVDKGGNDVIIQANNDELDSTIVLDEQATYRLVTELIDFLRMNTPTENGGK